VPAGFRGRVVEWDIPDPYARGLEAFRDARDLIGWQVQALLADLIPPRASA
jgi:protein-tyrosine-phosphatase